MTTGKIHSLESFGSVDGPGVRYIILYRAVGCAASSATIRIRGRWMEGRNIRQMRCWKRHCVLKPTGEQTAVITVSGGEPLLQIDFLLELFQKAKQQGVHTVIDTAGNPFTREGEFFQKFQALMEVTDLLLLDLKEINPERHRRLTGQENSNILDLARYLSEIGKPVWIRHVETLSPQQILVVKLLELPAVELEDRVRAELLENTGTGRG